MNFNPDMEKWAEWPAQGRAAVSSFPGDILEPFRVVVVGGGGVMARDGCAFSD